MITLINVGNKDNSGVYEYRGLSTDSQKPTENVPNGSIFIEMDSGKVYFYNEDAQTWVEFGG